MNQIALELEAYFHGHCHTFKTPVAHVIGTPFQQQVWQALQQLPFGTVVNYSDIAQMIGRPKVYVLWHLLSVKIRCLLSCRVIVSYEKMGN